VIEAKGYKSGTSLYKPFSPVTLYSSGFYKKVGGTIRGICTTFVPLFGRCHSVFIGNHFGTLLGHLKMGQLKKASVHAGYGKVVVQDKGDSCTNKSAPAQ
jgi:hypothetical protein